MSDATEAFWITKAEVMELIDLKEQIFTESEFGSPALVPGIEAQFNKRFKEIFCE